MNPSVHRRSIEFWGAVLLVATLSACGGGGSLPSAATSVLDDEVVEDTSPATDGSDEGATDPGGADDRPETSPPEPSQDGGSPEAAPTVPTESNAAPDATLPVDAEVATTSVTAIDDWKDITTNLVGLESSCGNVSFVAGHPQTDQVLVDIARRGLFSLNAAADGWDAIGQDGDPVKHRTQWIEFDPDDPARFWVSGAYGPGVYRTDDGGASFRQLPVLEHLDRVAVDMADPERSTVLAGTHESRALAKSVDGGQSWVGISEELPDDAGFASVPVVLGPEEYLLGTYRGDESGIFRTEDGGATWQRVYDGQVLGAPVVTDEYIAWNVNTGSGGLAVSTDGGASFVSSGAGPGTASSTLIEVADGVLATTALNGIGVTSDFGESWERVGEELPGQPYGIAFSAEREAFYAWRFTCNFDDDGNPVQPSSILQLPVDIGS